MADNNIKVVLAVDASEQAEKAFEWYIKTIHRPDNKLVLIHAMELLEAERNRMHHLTASAWEEALKKEKEKVKELEDKFNSRILELGLSGTIRTEGGSKAGEIIVKCADEEKATMVVMGTRGLGKVRRTILGSVSDFVVHHAHCPVIVCKQ